MPPEEMFLLHQSEGSKCGENKNFIYLPASSKSIKTFMLSVRICTVGNRQLHNDDDKGEKLLLKSTREI